MGQLEITTTPGTGATATLYNDVGSALHRRFYGSVDAALFGGMWYGIQFSIDVDGVVVDGEELSRLNVAESCWAYIDGMPGGASPDSVRTVLGIETMLYE